MKDPSATDWGNLARKLTRAGSAIDPVLTELFPPQQEDYLSAPFWHHMKSGGKRIRPALCLLCCEALGGDPSEALYFAAAVEIMHNMFLVHDDIEDGDAFRRDAPTLWRKFGLANAVNAADYMLGRAYQAILKSPVDERKRLWLLAEFTDAYEMTCRGQAMDINLRGTENLTVEDYLEMVTLKTGHYLALGMVGGGIVAGAGPEVVREIQNLGKSIGPAFQIRDDLIDLTRGKGRGGVAGNDIREGKPSILYAHALGTATPGDKQRLLGIMRKPRRDTTDADVEEVIGIYQRCGSMRFAQDVADRLTKGAFETIQKIPLEDKTFFRQVVRYLSERNT